MIHLWIVLISLLVFAISITLLIFRLRREGPAEEVIQGVLSVAGGLIAVISLSFPWVTAENNAILGLEIGNLTGIANPLFFEILTFFLPILALLTVAGGFIHLTGYKMGKPVILISSTANLLISLIVILVFLLPLCENSANKMEYGPAIFIFAALLAIIGVQIERKH